MGRTTERDDPTFIFRNLVTRIKLVTDDELGFQYVAPERFEIEDDGSVTIVVKAWRGP